jgi:hypothetical protein
MTDRVDRYQRDLTDRCGNCGKQFDLGQRIVAKRGITRHAECPERQK